MGAGALLFLELVKHVAWWWEVVNEFFSFAFLVDKDSLHLLNSWILLFWPYVLSVLLKRVNKQLGEGLSCQQSSAQHNSLINFDQWGFNVPKSDDLIYIKIRLMDYGNYQLCHERGRTSVFPDDTKLSAPTDGDNLKWQLQYLLGNLRKPLSFSHI